MGRSLGADGGGRLTHTRVESPGMCLVCWVLQHATRWTRLGVSRREIMDRWAGKEHGRMER